PQATMVSGYVMIVWGKQITMVDKPAVDTVFESDEPWSVAGIGEKLGPYFATRQPIVDGFTVIPG
ncbi:MAG: short chain dehydrogenase, partial [Candidatus Binatia bacterium]